MTRDDWVFVGIRLMGAWLVVQSLLTFSLLLPASEFPADGVARMWIQAVGTFLIGIALFLGACYLDTWIRKKDSRGLAAPSRES